MTDLILRGTRVGRDELSELGFSGHTLRFMASHVDRGFSEWDTEGDVPDTAGLYAFVIPDLNEPEAARVAYVGMTTHLWMVTKGAAAEWRWWRGLARYGRHRYAGATRVRVSRLVIAARRQGFGVSHWVEPIPDVGRVALLRVEEVLIDQWRLRETGWNRG